jgi:phosphomannomutase
MIYFAINHLDCAGGVMVTASHNPPQYNGFKVSKRKAKPVGEATGLARCASTPRWSTRRRSTARPRTAGREARPLGRVRQARPLVPRHEAGKKLKIVVDASNGMAGTMIPKIFGKNGGKAPCPA